MGMGGLGTGGAVPGSSGSSGWTPPGARDQRRRRRRGGRSAGRVAVWRLAAGAGAVTLAVIAGLLAGRPAPGGQAPAAPGIAVLVAARDLPAGAVPAATDLRTVQVPAPAVPADAVPPAGGSGTVGPLAVAVRRGDLLTGRQLGIGWAPAGALRAYSLPVGDGVEAGPLTPATASTCWPPCTGGPAPCCGRRRCCGWCPAATAAPPWSSWA